DKIIPKLVKTFPVNVVIGSDRLVALFPGDISHRSFRYNAELLFPGAGQNEVDRFLVRDVDRSLQSIERATLHGITRRPAIAAIAKVARVIFFSRGLERRDRVSPSKNSLGTSMQLN